MLLRFKQWNIIMSYLNKDKYYDKLEKILIWTIKNTTVDFRNYDDLWVKSGLGKNKMKSELNRQIIDNVLLRPALHDLGAGIDYVRSKNPGVPCEFKARINRVHKSLFGA